VFSGTEQGSAGGIVIEIVSSSVPAASGVTGACIWGGYGRPSGRPNLLILPLGNGSPCFAEKALGLQLPICSVGGRFPSVRTQLDCSVRVFRLVHAEC